MAHGETVARGKCGCCGGDVAVKINRGGKAYYRCDNTGCGVEVRHHWQTSSDKYMRRFVKAEADEGAENRGESQRAAPKKGGGLSSFFGGD